MWVLDIRFYATSSYIFYMYHIFYYRDLRAAMERSLFEEVRELASTIPSSPSLKKIALNSLLKNFWPKELQVYGLLFIVISERKAI